MKKYLPTLLPFVIVTLIILLLQKIGNKYATAIHDLLYANVFLLLLSLYIIALYKKALKHKNPNVFIRTVMASVLVKMILIASLVFCYMMCSKEPFKPFVVLVSMVLYMLYTIIEIIMVLKQNKHV